ncbi:MAG: hypothetical protein ACLQVM_15675 [Terriglobia bacterium]
MTTLNAMLSNIGLVGPIPQARDRPRDCGWGKPRPYDGYQGRSPRPVAPPAEFTMPALLATMKLHPGQAVLGGVSV